MQSTANTHRTESIWFSANVHSYHQNLRENLFFFSFLVVFMSVCYSKSARTYLRYTQISIELKLWMDLYTQSVLSSSVWWYFRFSFRFRFSIEFCVSISIEIQWAFDQQRSMLQTTQYRVKLIKKIHFVQKIARYWCTTHRTMIDHISSIVFCVTKFDAWLVRDVKIYHKVPFISLIDHRRWFSLQIE